MSSLIISRRRTSLLLRALLVSPENTAEAAASASLPVTMPPKSTKSNQSTGTTSSSGYLLTCDPPMKQFIIHLNDKKSADKKFILEDLDATHLLIKGDVRDEITRKVDEWMDEVRIKHVIWNCMCILLNLSNY